MEIDLEKLAEQMPQFDSHDEARSWFKQKFADSMLLRGSEMKQGERMYMYHLVKDSTVYKSYMENIIDDNPREVNDMTPFYSYNTIAISEHGDVHILS